MSLTSFSHTRLSITIVFMLHLFTWSFYSTEIAVSQHSVSLLTVANIMRQIHPALASVLNYYSKSCIMTVTEAEFISTDDVM